ncbi:MAG TPA: prepilin-type N-terminal cleavage/methylation domain-containing protein [Deltaproteobacteria bacterium]|nr:prepilin-type N-terminal cleavage/methylation domain-containing protein [Deltaproteobacteria bacterium]
MNRAGFALVELIVILVILGILLSIATMDFSATQRRKQIESRTRELFNDLNEARLNSIYTKKRHAIVMEPGSYAFRQYSSENEAKFASGTKVLRSVNSPYKYSKTGGTDFSGETILFDIRGNTNDHQTIYINPVNSGAMFDCIVIHTARTNMGQGGDSTSDGQPDSCTTQ